jgi:flagellar motor switch protein FliN/FliY
MTMNPIAERNDLLFSNAFLDTFVKTISEACGNPWLITAVPDDDVAVDETERVRIMLTLDGSVCGACLLEFHRSEASMLVSKLLHQPVNEFAEEQLEAMRKMADTASRAFCSAVEQEYGTFTINVTSASVPLFDKTNSVQVTAADNDNNRLSVVMCLNSALIEALSIPYGSESLVAGSVKSASGATERSAPEPVNLDLVMNVELNVTLRFGQRHLTLREVLDLTSGSVVELDRQVDEPVELLLNGEVIAKGEAVVIDGNYGLCVSEVLKPVSSLIPR